MRRLGLAVALAFSATSMAMAQNNATSSAQINNNPNSSVVTPGLARPPGTEPSPPANMGQPVGVPANMANNPTTPQIAVRPGATVGSPVPVAGAGGTTSATTGTDQQTFTITRWFRHLFDKF